MVITTTVYFLMVDHPIVHKTDPLIEKCLKLIESANVDFSWICNLNANIRFPKWNAHFSEDFKSWLSNTGKYIYLNEHFLQKDSNFTILMWKFGSYLENRLIKSYGNEWKDPFGSECSVHNCQLT